HSAGDYGIKTSALNVIAAAAANGGPGGVGGDGVARAAGDCGNIRGNAVGIGGPIVNERSAAADGRAVSSGRDKVDRRAIDHVDHVRVAGIIRQCLVMVHAINGDACAGGDESDPSERAHIEL